MYKTTNDVEKSLGLKYYFTPNKGIDGKIKVIPEDFIVQEILRGGIILPLKRDKPIMPASNNGKYLRIILFKRGVDTLTAINKLSKISKIPFSNFQFLGLKDARALTSQLISVKCDGCNINGINNINTKNIEVLSSYKSNTHVSTHELWGNKFTVTIRTEEDDEKLFENMTIIQSFLSFKQLPSYFGHQRFSVNEPFNHIVGKLILKRMYDKAVKLILSRRHHEFDLLLEETLANEKYMKIDYENKEYFSISERIPTFIMKIFLQSYQSYLFNIFINKRIDMGIPIEYAIEGDIVSPLETTVFREEDILFTNNKNIEKVNGLIKRGLFSILYPIPGFSLWKMPKDEAYEPIAKVMEEEKISLNEFLFKEFPEISMVGYYRPLKFKVYNFTWNITKEGNILCRFILKKGFYATIVLREIIKPSHPDKSGFK